MKNLFQYDLFIFDLDDTLYDEREYLFGAYCHLAAKISYSGDTKEIEEFLKIIFEKEGRDKLFDKLIKRFQLSETDKNLFLDVLRTYTPPKKILIEPHILKLLKGLKERKKRLVLLTNGNVQQQKNKIKNIQPDLNGIFEFVVFANEIEPKPSAKCVEFILDKTKMEKESCLMIGDSETDRQAAETANVSFAHVSQLKDGSFLK